MSIPAGAPRPTFRLTVIGGLAAGSLLVGCGRPVPIEETQAGTNPDQTTESAAGPTTPGETDDNTTDDNGSDGNGADGDGADGSSDGAGTDESATAESMSDASQDGTATDGAGPESDGAAAQDPTPIIITADNLEGVVDESPDRAGVRVTSAGPIIAVNPAATPATGEEGETTAGDGTTDGGGGDGSGDGGSDASGTGQASTHVVQPGDTISVIAQTYGVSTRAIAEANNLDDVDAIKPGDELVIPAP